MRKILNPFVATLVIISVCTGRTLADDSNQKSIAIIGSTVRTDSSPVLGCANYDHWKRLLEFVYQKDQDAFTKFAAAHCNMIEPNIQTYVEESSLRTNSVCIRPRGETTCFWVQRSRVIK